MNESTQVQNPRHSRLTIIYQNSNILTSGLFVCIGRIHWRMEYQVYNDLSCISQSDLVVSMLVDVKIGGQLDCGKKCSADTRDCTLLFHVFYSHNI